MIGLNISPVIAMKTGKILGFLVGAVIAVLALVLVFVQLLVNPNDYTDKITAAVKAATGRDLMLHSDIKLAVFPWIALELGPATLGNVSGFGATPLVSWQRASVRAKLWPLLWQRLEVSRVAIDGLDVRLFKNAAGTGDWEGFGKPAGAADSAAVPLSRGPVIVGFPALTVTHAHVSYGNVVLDNVSLETAKFANGTVPVVLHLEAQRGVAGEHGTLEVRVDFSNPALQRWRLAALNVVGEVSLAGNSRPVLGHLNVPLLDVDLGAHTVALPGFDMTLAGAHLTGAISGTRIVDDLALTGSVTLAPLVLREFWPRLGMTAPLTADERALASLSGSFEWAYGGNALRLGKLAMMLDDTQLRGTLAVEDLTTRAVRFALTADALNVDRYRAPAGAASPGVRSTKTADGAAVSAAPLDVAGTLAVGSLQAARLALTEVRATLVVKDGVTRLFPLTAQIDGGQCAGDITWDRRNSIPELRVDAQVSGIDMTSLLASEAKAVHLSGRGNVVLKAAGRGAGVEAILRSLNGHMEASVSNGAVEGIDLGFQLARAQALLRRPSALTLPGAPPLQDTKRTRFAALQLSGVITQGVMATHDLLIASPVLKITGQGTANLVSKAIDFSLLADTLRSAQGVPMRLPVTVSGTTDAPTIRPDLQALASGALRQSLRDVLKEPLGETLKGWFGKP